MGYNVHITRAAEWSESESTPITIDEWREYIASDPEMRLYGVGEARSSAGQVIRIEGEGLAEWTVCPPRDTNSGDIAWMNHHRGRIVVKNPDALTLMKMCSIAKNLGAHVQGDEREEYPQAGDIENAEAEVEDRLSPSKRSWWQRLVGR